MSNLTFQMTLHRVDETVVEAVGRGGGRVRMGPAGTPDALTPVEVLLAALAGCAGLDLGAASARREIDAGAFEIEARGTKPAGPVPLSRVEVEYRVPGVDSETLEALVAAVRELCTVAVTVSQGCPVDHVVSAEG